MIRFIIGIVMGVLAAAFAIQNSGAVDIRFLYWSFTTSRAIIILTVFVAGMVLGWALVGKRRT